MYELIRQRARWAVENQPRQTYIPKIAIFMAALALGLEIFEQLMRFIN